ncbi:unnamed protein product [Cyclocybe aegerita]|uniref:Uncharacterized protein n=1 Tax=Cyclocybe aegerita TaxID=1973307 RepID=A0A8S0X6S8_CYCAE|nr:unnamed protein product [Cyclocybe aegerita]
MARRKDFKSTAIAKKRKHLVREVPKKNAKLTKARKVPALSFLPSIPCSRSHCPFLPLSPSPSTTTIPHTMTLLTPPSSSHRSDRDKENKFLLPIAGPSTRTVAWASKNSFHLLSTPPKPPPPSKQRPEAPKSILKKPNLNAFLSLPVDTGKEREVTPEPSDPLVNLHYLNHPVEQILSTTNEDGKEPLGKLIEGYNVLAARLRASVSDATDADASWPLFQPLRKNAPALVSAIVRDLGRALVDPLAGAPASEEECLPKFTLPSPQSSPAKKKGGMTAEQVKYARDLCTTCHSVIRLLNVVLSLPAIYTVFQENELRQILTAILAIPLADSLPTPNSRKTCALAIGLIQGQRLPADVLKPAADRIAYALRRGLDGELGKEGKKGSANDGLRAIHDLCMYLPGVFLPAFIPLLPSILSNLLAPTLVLRTQACHALGGFVLAATSIPLSSAHTKISSTIAAHITALPTPKKASDSPTKQTECQIVRTLRTTMSNADPAHVAQGPVWAICVLASFVVLLGSRVCNDGRVNRIVSSLLGLGMRSKKSSVRALTCLAWRTMTWAYFQPPLPVDSDEESEVDDDERTKSKNARQVHCKVMTSIVDCHAGIASIAALLGDESSVGDEPLRLSLSILQQMTAKAGSTCLEAMDAMGHMVSRPHADQYEMEEGWDKNLLIPKGLFDAVPGLLTTEFKNLSGAVRPIFDNGVIVNDIRCLTREEMSKKWVFNGMVGAWRTALGALEMWDDAEVPENIVDVWSGLLRANVAHLQDRDDDTGISAFASLAIKHVNEILENPELNFRPKKSQTPSKSDAIPDSDDTILDLDADATCSNGELRLRVVESLWTAMRKIFPLSSLREAGETLLACIMRNDHSLLADNARLSGSTAPEADEEGGERARNAWVALCVDIITVCDPEAVRVFWACEEDAPVTSQKGTWGWNWTKEFTNAVWKTFVQRWKRREGHWEGGVVLLGVPFTDRHAWTISSNDFVVWEDLLSFTNNKALDHGIDTCTVLDTTASFVSCFQTPGALPDASTRLVDLLFSHLDAADMRDVPLNLLELASETMRATYPPEPRNKPVMMWLARSLMTVIEHCPEELCLRLLQSLQEGLCLWLGDECKVWTEDDILYDIIPLYQHILVSIQVLPSTLSTLKALGSILASIFRTRVPPLAAEAFVEYWKLEYAQVPAPTAGWPEPIRHSLRSVGLLPPEVDEQASSSSTVCPSTPLAATFSLPPAPFPSSSSAGSSCFSTPTRSPSSKRDPLSQIPSPQRPQKPFGVGAYPAVPSSPVSPLRSRRSSTSSTSSSRSHRRVPLSPVQPRHSPLKRRRLNAKDEESDEEDKENSNADTPSRINGPKLVSVAERIAQILKQPKGTPSPVANAKKRRLEEEKEEGVKETPVSAKRLKTKMRPKCVSVKKAVVPATVAVPFPSVESAAETQTQDVLSVVQSRPTVPLPKRKREDGIIGVSVAPKVHSTSLDGQAITTPRKIDLTKVARLRRSVSIPESLLLTLGSAAPRKRKRTESDIGRSSDQPLPSIQQLADSQQGQQTPTPLGGRTMTLGKRHAIPTGMWRTCSAPVSMTLQLSDDLAQDAMDAPTPSSDDDPHLGQVTPHHLISPVMQRKGFGAVRTPSLKGLFGDDDDDEDVEMPGSDDSAASDDSADSNESDSPTKEFVSRQLRRMGSESRFFKASPGVSV